MCERRFDRCFKVVTSEYEKVYLHAEKHIHVHSRN